jgi:metallo-beta-lactamase family protein
MRKWRRGQQNTPPPSPLYGIEDAEACLEQFRPVEYEQEVQVAPGVSARWLDAGHIIGAASVEMWLSEGSRRHKLVFSGDIGSSGRPILRDPTVPASADFVVMESTYGDRVHPPEEDVNGDLAEIINRTVRQKGQILVPAFAVGRTQDLLYRLDRLMSAGSIPKLPVFVDSPLAKKATEIVSAHQECYDLDALRLLGSGDDPISFPSLKFTHSVEESQKLNNVDYPAIIISASGMCTAGRIRHHLHHRLERGNNLILFVGFQAEGTLGRLLVDGVPRVKLFGRQHRVRARVAMIEGLSAHGDQTELLSWAKAISGPEAFFITHGEPQSAFTFAGLLERETGIPCSVPSRGVGIDLADTEALAELHRITQQDRGRLG